MTKAKPHAMPVESPQAPISVEMVEHALVEYRLTLDHKDDDLDGFRESSWFTPAWYLADALNSALSKMPTFQLRGALAALKED